MFKFEKFMRVRGIKSFIRCVSERGVVKFYCGILIIIVELGL